MNVNPALSALHALDCAAAASGDRGALRRRLGELDEILADCSACLRRIGEAKSPLRVIHCFSDHDTEEALRLLEYFPNLFVQRWQDLGEDVPPAQRAATANAIAETLHNVTEGRGRRMVFVRTHGLGDVKPPIGNHPVREVVLAADPADSFRTMYPAGHADDALAETFARTYLEFLDATKCPVFATGAGRQGEIAEAMGLAAPPAIGAENTHEPAVKTEPTAQWHGNPLIETLYARLGLTLPRRPEEPATGNTPDRADWTRLLPAEPLIICCHHKSGTHFLRRVFEKLADIFDLPIWMKFYNPAPESWKICFHQHSRIAELLIGTRFRGLHCVRHPKSLVYSAALYHETCTEPWVDVPLKEFSGATFAALSDRDAYNTIKNPKTPMEERVRLMSGRSVLPPPYADFESRVDFGGKTYRQMLRDAPTLADKLIFEMNCFSRGVILDMIMFPADMRFQNITLEAISRDREMKDLRRLFLHLGFRGAALDICLETAAKHCLWNAETLPAAATSGVSEEWQTFFVGQVAEEYARLFGAAEESLGYGGGVVQR